MSEQYDVQFSGEAWQIAEGDYIAMAFEKSSASKSSRGLAWAKVTSVQKGPADFNGPTFVLLTLEGAGSVKLPWLAKLDVRRPTTLELPDTPGDKIHVTTRVNLDVIRGSVTTTFSSEAVARKLAFTPGALEALARDVRGTLQRDYQNQFPRN